MDKIIPEFDRASQLLDPIRSTIEALSLKGTFYAQASQFSSSIEQREDTSIQRFLTSLVKGFIS